jgi:hypothetical protein
LGVGGLGRRRAQSARDFGVVAALQQVIKSPA